MVAGIYMADRPSTIAHISLVLGSSRLHHVEQRWIALAPNGKGRFDHPMTHMVQSEPASKFELLDRLVADAKDYDWLLLCDDDIEMEMDALDRLVNYAIIHDFALCQPARTADSFTDHPLVQVMPGLTARRTRFVEIGPLTCVRRDAAKLLLPFGKTSGMGWGLDFVWPVILENAGLRMGIIDAVPMAHRIRRSALSYSYDQAHQSMYRLMANQAHLTMDQAFTVLEAYQ